MQRRTLTPRPHWQNSVESAGMSYHTTDGQVYWDESACYVFSSAEIDELELATIELQKLCIEVVEQVISRKLYNRLMIPPLAVPLIERSWDNDEPSLLGRFDLAYDGQAPPKLLEYNADTPTALLEASVIQWFWLKERFPGADQFNSIHEKLIEGWRELQPSLPAPLIFSCVKDAPEDVGNLEYLRDTAIQAGLATRQIFVEDIGYERERSCFIDLDEAIIAAMFKLYPWEWLISEPFGRYLEPSRMVMIEPAWKMILSNKGILPLLWERSPGHPNLLRSGFDPTQFRDNFVSKPFFSREGGNISIHRNGALTEFGGTYGGNGAVFQDLAHIPCFDGNYPVIGSWVINGESAGIGIREDTSVVTSNSSRFIPHYFR